MSYRCPMWRECPCHNPALRTVEALVELGSRRQRREAAIDAHARRRKQAAAKEMSGHGVLSAVDEGYRAFCARRGG